MTTIGIHFRNFPMNPGMNRSGVNAVTVSVRVDAIPEGTLIAWAMANPAEAAEFLNDRLYRESFIDRLVDELLGHAAVGRFLDQLDAPGRFLLRGLRLVEVFRSSDVWSFTTTGPQVKVIATIGP